MSKNVVVCCDGTANEFAQDRTNVVKLSFTLVNDPSQQATYYHPGVGTMEPPGAMTKYSRGFMKMMGQAMGYGLEADIRDAYVFLMNHYGEGDRVFIFGFSRGAYTARAVTALLHMYGLLQPGNEALVPYAIRMMMAITNLRAKKSSDSDQKTKEYFDLGAQFRDHFGRSGCNLHFVGVWDTVSSVGWIENPVRLPHTSSNPDIQIGRHAIAIDERRAFFRTNLWRPVAPGGGPKDLKQVWFPGVHCDVGGGYPESESGLSKIALQWMLNEAIAAGLLTDPARVALVLGQAGGGYAAPDPNAMMHESLTGMWRAAEFVPKRHYDWKTKTEGKRPNLFRRRTIPDGAMVHASAYARGPEYAKRLPATAVKVT
jgi:uncharacterized protein (DUF2235 family)